MFWTLLVAHALGIVASSIVGRSRPMDSAEQNGSDAGVSRGIGPMRTALAVAAIAPAITAVWVASRLVRSAEPWIGELTWVEGLDIALRFRLDAVSSMMTLLVSGIGALIFVYAIGYFNADSPGASRFPASMLAFSASMLGLVMADSVWTLFIFWEFTSVTSFLLVGHKHQSESVRAAARRALVITGAGGLVLLAGLLVLADAAGTTSLTGLASGGLANDTAAIDGSSATLAAVLIMIGAATKSAQFPFHVWLPGAMAAPTPVSAYLHSATMVKAGVLLVAVTGSAFADVAAWSTLGSAFGIASMMWGAIGALRHRDAKLILAWGTVSQLGLLITLLSVGTGKAVFAATSILFAHALFKAALFAVVGEIDIRTGTRDIDELRGLWRSMPIATVTATLAGLSMAGVPPLLGFAAKEAAIEAVLGLEGLQALIVGAAVIGGSVLTVAYTVRFLIVVFGPGPAGSEDTAVGPRRLAMTAPSALLGFAGLLGFIAMGTVNSIVIPAATELNEKAEVYQLIRWPGLKTAFVISIGIVAAGAVVGALIARRPSSPAPQPVGADAADATIDGVLGFAPIITGRVQHGSLPVYLATMAIAAIIASLSLVAELSLDHVVLWDRPVQGALALLIIASAISGAFVASRFAAALTLGAVGIGMSGIFVVHGAPDLALTQLLVETIVVVGFVLGLGHLSKGFPSVQSGWRTIRLGISVAGGLAVMAALAAASANPSGQAPLEALRDGAVDEGGGKNIVNVVLTDLRALDTLGEVVVLAVVALGVLALANAPTPSREPEPDSTNNTSRAGASGSAS